jgi:BirA family biotin operon repressor/biotin-[acetyl-CoA-carboxylase] ligase
MIDASAPVETFEEIDSTMLEARRRAERGELGPVWLVAERQTAGRGRRGRTWITKDGNLLATYLFATDKPPAQIALLGFVAGLGIAEAIDEHLGAGSAALKWPNDVLIDGAKAAGILLESGSLGAGSTWASLAFGVNLADAPGGIDQPTVSLRAVLPPDAEAPTPLDFLARIRLGIERWSARLESEGFEPLRAAWLARAYGMGRDARVLQGEAVLEGRFAGLSPRGELELDTADGRRHIAAGDVFFPQAG